MTITRNFRLICLSVIVLTVFYPSLFTPLCLVDDTNLIVFDTPDSRLSDLLHTLFYNGGYYRPLLVATFVLDNYLWLLQESFLHLENILLHLINMLLLYGVTERLGRRLAIPDTSNVPFWTALLFGLHPLATESVNWISGRPDPLACLFLLFSFRLLLDWCNKPSLARLFGMQCCFLLACLSKETAVFFVVPAQLMMIVFTTAQQEGKTKVAPEWRQLLTSLLTVWPASLAFIVTTAGYFSLRRFTAVTTLGTDRGMNRLSLNTVQNLNESSIFDKIFEIFKTIGFYSKKIFIPWPLNFNIVDISDWYILGGLLTLILLTVFCWKRRDLVAGLFLSAVLVASSALLVSVGKLAWTWYAERYLYISLIFFIPGGCFWLYEKIGDIWQGQLFRILLLLICGASLITTVHRNLIWMDSFAFYEDNYNKAPRLPLTIRNYATALAQQGRIKESNCLLRMLPKKPRVIKGTSKK